MAKPEQWHQKAVDEKRGEGNHFTQLFDQDEDAAGQKINEATGKPINNSPKVTGNDEKLQIVKPGKGSDDALGKLTERDDAAAKWLREHGE